MAEAEDTAEGIYFRSKMVISDCTLKVNSEVVLSRGFSFLFSSLLAKSSQAELLLAPEDGRCTQDDLPSSQTGFILADTTVCMLYLSISQYIFF